MDIESCIHHLTNLWHGHPGVTDQAFADFERQINLAIPPDLKTFMLWSNGGEAKLPNIYFSIWEVERIMLLNRDYQIQHYLGQNIIGIGSDGGPICFLLDYRGGPNAQFSSINFGDLDPNEINIIAPTFTDALEMAIEGRLSDNDL
jgi:hypothetical protein